MSNKSYFDKENEFRKNKDSILSKIASSMLMKIILTEKLFREYKDSSLENITLKKYNIVESSTSYIINTQLKNNLIFLDSNNKPIENSYTQNLKKNKYYYVKLL